MDDLIVLGYTLKFPDCHYLESKYVSDNQTCQIYEYTFSQFQFRGFLFGKMNSFAAKILTRL